MLLDEFKKIMLPKSLTQSEHETPGGEGASFELSDFIMQNPASKQRTSTISNSKILSEEEINKVRTKFLEDIDFAYEEAIARHVSSDI